MSSPKIRQVFSQLIGVCELALTWEEAYYRVLGYCENNADLLAHLDIKPSECVTVANLEIWPRIVQDRTRPIYLGYQFL